MLPLGVAADARPLDGETTSDARDARAAAARVRGPKVVVVGDVACEPGRRVTRTTCRHRATSRLARSLAPRRVIAVGDLQYENGELSHFRSSYDGTWGRLKRITRPVPGNHEYGTAGAAGFYEYFGLSAPGYRAVKIGSWRVYLLNSQCAQIDCAAQKAWLAADMSAHPVACSAIATHFPRYSSGEHGNTSSMAAFWKIAHNHGADLALAGHDHHYERFAAMNANGKLRRSGLRSFVVGTGGKSLYGRGTTVRGSRYFRADKFGVLEMRLGVGAYSWRFRSIGGGIRDAGRARCH